MGLLFARSKPPYSDVILDSDNSGYKQLYEAINEINFGAIFSAKIANYTVNQSTVDVVDNPEREMESLRGEMLTTAMNTMWDNADVITSRVVGEGGAVLLPYITDEQTLAYDWVSQSRFYIYKKKGAKLTGVLILSDAITNEQNEVTHYLWKNYNLEGDLFSIRIKRFPTPTDIQAIKNQACWEDAEYELGGNGIRGCDRLLLAYLKSPVDSRQEGYRYGVPITYGCDSVISEIRECLKQITREYELKKPFIAVDKFLFGGKDSKLKEDGIYQSLNIGGKLNDGAFFQIFDPAIRDSSYYARLNELYQRLEKAVGVSRGFLSEQAEVYVNEVAIRRANADTAIMIDKFQSKMWNQGLEDFKYACDALLSIMQPSLAQSDTMVKTDWYDPFDEPTAQFMRLIEGKLQGWIRDEEGRQWLFPKETLEESKQAVADIRESKPVSEMGMMPYDE